MVDVYLYGLKCLPESLPIYKEKNSNVYLNVYLLTDFSVGNVYLHMKMGRRCKILVDIEGRRCSSVGLTYGVDVEKGVFSSVGMSFWVDVAPHFYTSMVDFIENWRLIYEK